MGILFRRVRCFVLCPNASLPSGKPVASDPTLRTREECELLCTASADSADDKEGAIVRLGGEERERTIGGENGVRNGRGEFVFVKKRKL